MSEKGYIDSRLEEGKLQLTKTLAVAFSGLLSTLLIIVVFAIVLGFLSFALIQWLNILLGAPWGTLCVCGALLILAFVLILLRKKLFRNGMTRLFSGLLVGETPVKDYDALEKKIVRAQADTRIQEERMKNGYGFMKAAPVLLRVGKLIFRTFRKSGK